MDLPKFEIGINEISNRLPHRYPFLLVDRVVGFAHGPDPAKLVGRKIHGYKNVTINEHFFMGHFPENPVMPGVLQVEAMAQTGALACVPDAGSKLDVRIAKISSARFRKPVLPGDRLDLFAEITSEKSMVLSLSCTAQVNGQKVSEAEMLAKILSI